MKKIHISILLAIIINFGFFQATDGIERRLTNPNQVKRTGLTGTQSLALIKKAALKSQLEQEKRKATSLDYDNKDGDRSDIKKRKKINISKRSIPAPINLLIDEESIAELLQINALMEEMKTNARKEAGDFLCDICHENIKYVFNQEELDLHKKMPHRFQRGKCSPSKCPVVTDCKFQAKKASLLIPHIRVHKHNANPTQSPYPFKCPYHSPNDDIVTCDRQFNLLQFNAFACHVRSDHTSTKHYRCPIDGCDSAFFIEPHYMNHYRDMHKQTERQ